MNKSGKRIVRENDAKNLYMEISVLQKLINYSGISIEYIADRTGSRPHR